MYEQLKKAKSVGCIGTSSPNEEEINTCIAVGYALATIGKKIVSGNAIGCDFAYATGANFVKPQAVTLYLPNPSHNENHWVFGNILITETKEEWQKLARDYHPKYDSMNQNVRQLFDRNAGIVLNSDVIIALPCYRTKSWGGGTGHGMKIAKALGKHVYNIEDVEMAKSLKEYLRFLIGSL